MSEKHVDHEIIRLRADGRYVMRCDDAALPEVLTGTEIMDALRAPGLHSGDVEALARKIVSDLGVEIQRPYPQRAFRELTSEQWGFAREALESAGLSLDRVSASNMRHVGKAMCEGNERFDEVVLAALRSRPVEPEPVAWAIRCLDNPASPTWFRWGKESPVYPSEGYEAVALYASPVAPREEKPE